MLPPRQSNTISATVIPFSASVSNSSSGSSTTISGSGAVSLNDMLTKVNAYGLDSSITAGQDVNVNAQDSTQITATVITISASASASEGGKSTSGSVGASFSENLVGYKLDGTSAPMEVRAYLDNSSVSAGGALSLDASTAGMLINSIVVSGSVAVAASAQNSYSLGGSGVYSANQIALDVEAHLSNITTPVTAASVSITASDTSSIMATAGAASLAASLSSSGNAAAIALGVSLATNEIDNVVQAYIANVPTVTTTSGGISVTSRESATINAVSAAAAAPARRPLRRRGTGVAIVPARPAARRLTSSWAPTTPTSATPTSTSADRPLSQRHGRFPDHGHHHRRRRQPRHWRRLCTAGRRSASPWPATSSATR